MFGENNPELIETPPIPVIEGSVTMRDSNGNIVPDIVDITPGFSTPDRHVEDVVPDEVPETIPEAGE
jgi:hypothetical protein